MRTRFAPERLADPSLAEAEREIRRCVHCGFCLAACPTYLVLRDERDSPRGRIRLMQEMLESGGVPSAETVRHVDRCLTCLSCVTACPSGVDFGRLVETAREHIEARYRRPPIERFWRWVIAFLVPNPQRMRAAVRWTAPLRLLAPVLAKIPALQPAAAMLRLAPWRIPRASTPAALPPADAPARVALLGGCAERVLRPEIGEAACRVLGRMGLSAGVVAGEGCCGALVFHIGQRAEALAAARRNIAVWSRAIDEGGITAIVATASGCGTMLKDYRRLFAGDALWAERARQVSALSRDICEFIEEKGVPAATGHADPLAVAYLAPCSLQHGQHAAGAAHRLMEQVGFTVSTPEEAHICCGSAGSYNMLQSAISAKLRARKAERLAATGAKVLASGNVGCLTQIGESARMPGVHPIELIDWATGGRRPRRLGG